MTAPSNMTEAMILAIVDRATAALAPAEAAMFVEGLIDQLTDRLRKLDCAATDAAMIAEGLFSDEASHP
jgi:hypothetical protein